MEFSYNLKWLRFDRVTQVKTQLLKGRELGSACSWKLPVAVLVSTELPDRTWLRCSWKGCYRDGSICWCFKKEVFLAWNWCQLEGGVVYLGLKPEMPASCFFPTSKWKFSNLWALGLRSIKSFLLRPQKDSKKCVLSMLAVGPCQCHFCPPKTGQK